MSICNKVASSKTDRLLSAQLFCVFSAPQSLFGRQLPASTWKPTQTGSSFWRVVLLLVAANKCLVASALSCGPFKFDHRPNTGVRGAKSREYLLHIVFVCVNGRATDRMGAKYLTTDIAGHCAIELASLCLVACVQLQSTLVRCRSSVEIFSQNISTHHRFQQGSGKSDTIIITLPHGTVCAHYCRRSTWTRSVNLVRFTCC